MVFLEDPITAEGPSRTTLEEEEEQAEGLVEQYRVAPTIEWTDGPVQSEVVVFLVGQAAALLAGTHLLRAAGVGEVSVPELRRLRSPYEEEWGLEHTTVHRSAIARCAAGVLLVEAAAALAPEQAHAWAQGVLAALAPERVVLATTLPAGSYRGDGSPADEDLVFSLHTSGSAPAAGGAPELPPGTVLEGLAAAVFCRCEVQGLPAAAVVGVQMAPVPDAAFVSSLGAAAGAVLGAAACAEQPRAELLAAVAAATDRIYRSSAANSIFA